MRLEKKNFADFSSDKNLRLLPRTNEINVLEDADEYLLKYLYHTQEVTFGNSQKKNAIRQYQSTTS
jgi:hypothetical protein